ncbi:MAG: hypothetical protein Q4G25_11170 [Paracoccus sp. (in: a-proteobacteria)]|nr:hypothetical protein [Paracoccus sp. (in: a-proteobacteria)]
MKIQGLNALQKMMGQMSSFARDLDGEIASLRFDPFDPESIELALQEINDAVDNKARTYKHNDWVIQLAERIKENARQQILDKAAAARAKDR